MNIHWQALAEQVWQVRPAVLWCLAALYLVPVLRFITLPIAYGRAWFMTLNRRLGKWEYTIGWFRDSIGVLYLAGGMMWHVRRATLGNHDAWLVVGVATSGLVLSVLQQRWRRHGRDQLITFVSEHPTIHPQEFFDHLFCTAGGVRHRFPVAPYRTINPAAVDFRSPERRDRLRSPFIGATFATLVISRLCLRAYRLGGDELLRRAAFAFAVVWGGRLVQLVRAAVIVEEGERLRGLPPAMIYLFNHASIFDFIVAPFLFTLGAESRAASQRSLPRHFLARDHFFENPILYRWLGIGRVCERLGMIFVERKRVQEGAARAVVAGAAAKLVNDSIPIALYPQGTRARGTVDATGHRLGAAYYAVGPRARLEREGGHLKKGAAHLATNVALELARMGSSERVALIPIGFTGTAVVCPRGSCRIQSGVTIRIRVGEPILVATQMKGSEIDDERVATLHHAIDDALRTTLKVHADLERRFLEEMRRVLDPHQIEEIAVALRAWRGADPLVFVILDYIYACRPEHWRPFLGELSHRLIECAPRETLVELRNRVARTLARR